MLRLLHNAMQNATQCAYVQYILQL